MRQEGAILNGVIRTQQAKQAAKINDYVLITGASQGLGRAFAEEFAKRGADLILVSLPCQNLTRTAHDIARRYDVRTQVYEADLTAERSPETMFQWIQDRGFPVSVLINNAGVGYNGRFDDSTLRENEACILLNNLATVQITRLLLPELRRHDQAHILNVSSLAAFFPMPFMPVYAPSKAFILNFSLALRQEMRDSSVQVSALCPNGIRTNEACRAKIEKSGLAGKLTCKDPDEVAAVAVKQMLEGRDVIVPGALNKVLVAAGKYVPRSLITGVVTRFWGKTPATGRAQTRRRAATAARRRLLWRKRAVSATGGRRL